MAVVNVDSYTFLLFWCYFAIFVLANFQIGRLIYYRTKVLSWHFAFLLLLSIWALLRMFFWLFFGYTRVFMSYLLFWLPQSIQFATFSLLVLYYAHAIEHTRWKDLRRRAVTFYSITNFIFLLFFIVIWSLAIRYGTYSSTEGATVPNWLERIASAWTSTTFLILVWVMAWYGYKLAQQMRLGNVQLPSIVTGSSNKTIMAVTLIIFVCFTVRAVYDFITTFSNISVNVANTVSVRGAAMIVGLYVMFEILPALLVFLLFWQPPPRNKRNNETKPLLPPTKVSRMAPVDFSSAEVGHRGSMPSALGSRAGTGMSPGMFASPVTDMDPSAFAVDQRYSPYSPISPFASVLTAGATNVTASDIQSISSYSSSGSERASGTDVV